MGGATVGIRDGRVVLFNPGPRLAVAFSWRAAVDVAHAMMWKARGLLAPDPEKVAAVRVRREANDILIEEVGRAHRLVFIAPLAAAHTVGEALIAQARLLEEQEKAEQVVFDQAILNRIGKRLGLLTDRRLAERAMHEAHWNSRLRRYLPGGVRSQEVVGKPTLCNPGGSNERE
jgi:hypothetical protein